MNKMCNKVRASWLKYNQYLTLPAIALILVIGGCNDGSTGQTDTYSANTTTMPVYTTSPELNNKFTSNTTATTVIATTAKATDTSTTTTITTTQPTTLSSATETITTLTMPITTEQATQTTQATTPPVVGDSYAIPEIDCQFKAYMRYTAFAAGTPQQALQTQCWTGSDGIRRYGDDIVVALGTYYSSTVGERFLITLSSGNSFTAVIGDVKADCHTDPTNRYNVRRDGTGSMIEFIVDVNALQEAVRRSGDISTYPQFAGQVTAIQKIT